MKKLLQVILPLAVFGVILGVTLNWGSVQKAYAGFSASILCENISPGSSWICEAFPKTSGATHSWTTTGPLSIPNNPGVDVVPIQCPSMASGSGTVRVTVTLGGVSHSASRRLTCRGITEPL